MPPKRSRTEQSVDIENDHSKLNSKKRKASTQTPVKTRALTSCERCRERHKRCDNVRPNCGYCSKKSLECVYTEDVIPSPWDETGERILKAIDELSNVVKTQRPQCTSCLQRSSVYIRPESVRPMNGLIHGHEFSREDDSDAIALQAHDANETSQRSFELVFVTTQGTDSILKWSILAPFRIQSCSVTEDDHMHDPQQAVPNMSYNQLVQLVDNYVDGVHVKNPILDLSELHQLISQVAENGIDWSMQTCLVSLVCAIGAITQRYPVRHQSSDSQATPATPRNYYDIDSNMRLSLQFWSIAMKRIGIAIGQNSIAATQCLCLAGIFYLHHMQPLQAWKYFNLAGASWSTLAFKQGSDGDDIFENNNDSQSFTLMQSLYFTIWKSECELKVELDVPGPILDNVDFPYAFPLPPTIDSNSPLHEVSENERIWYYYLAEIAARHLLNRILRMSSWRKEQPTNSDLRQMIAHADILEAQVHEWHTSLPSILRFDIPDGYKTEPAPDQVTEILRNRYLACRELVSRPFLRLCVESSQDVEPELRDRLTSFASLNVRYCMLRLYHTAPHVHQGTWFGPRNVATSALILSAVQLAKKRPWLGLAQEIVLPENWKEKVAAAMDVFSQFWHLERAGLAGIAKVVQGVLSAVDDT